MSTLRRVFIMARYSACECAASFPSTASAGDRGKFYKLGFARSFSFASASASRGSGSGSGSANKDSNSKRRSDIYTPTGTHIHIHTDRKLIRQQSLAPNINNLFQNKPHTGKQIHIHTDRKLIQQQSLAPNIHINNVFQNKPTIESIASEMHTKGFATVPVSSGPILSPATCQSLKEDVIPNLFRGNFDTGIYPDEWHWREGISRNDAVREMCNSWKSSRSIASIVLHEQLGEFISQVMGWENVGVRLAQDDIVWKPPQLQSESQSNQHQNRLRNKQNGNENENENQTRRRIDTVGFHQDSAYISTQFEPYENNSVTVWMALDDADEENGCLEYAVGSHRWRPILHNNNLVSEEMKMKMRVNDTKDDGYGDTINISSFHGSDESSYRNGLHDAAIAAGIGIGDNLENLCSAIEIESVPVKMGHAVLHHQDVWHGSGPNRSNTRHRRALVAHYIRGDVKFVDDQVGAGAHEHEHEHEHNQPFGKSSYIYGRYKRYKSNDVDETFFPIVYGATGMNNTGAEKGLKRTSWIDTFVSS